LEPSQRDDSDTRLQSVDTAEARRDADGANEVRSVFEERHPGRQRSGRSSGGAAWCARYVPWILGDAVELVCRLPEVTQHEGHVGLSDDDRSGLPQPPRDRAIRVRHEIREGGIAPGGVHPGDVEAVLDRHGYAVQRSGVVATGGRFVGGGRFSQGGLRPEFHDSVQRWVGGFDPRKQRLGELARGDLLATNRLCRVGR
jgi:hypothetical protein